MLLGGNRVREIRRRGADVAPDHPPQERREPRFE
jgi:hypothetical protein